MGTERASIEFWFEFASTYSYPAAMRVEEAAARAGRRLVWRPFLLGPLFRAQDWNDSPFNLYPAKGRHMWRDLARVCASQGLPFTPPSTFPRRGLLAARIACRYRMAPWLPVFVRAVYRANFADDRDIADPAVLTFCLEGAGVEAKSCLTEAQSADTKDALRRATEEAAERGIFGAPTFIVGDELFWGNDRLDTALAWEPEGPPSPRVRFRRGVSTDATGLSELAFRSKAHWGYDDAFMGACREELTLSAEQIEWCPTFVLESGGNAVGFYSVGALSAERIELNHLFLDPPRIGRGEGRALLEHAARHAAAHGYRTLVIHSDPHAESFYVACGALRVGESPSASVPGRSLPVLELPLEGWHS